MNADESLLELKERLVDANRRLHAASERLEHAVENLKWMSSDSSEWQLATAAVASAHSNLVSLRGGLTADGRTVLGEIAAVEESIRGAEAKEARIELERELLGIEELLCDRLRGSIASLAHLAGVTEVEIHVDFNQQGGPSVRIIQEAKRPARSLPAPGASSSAPARRRPRESGIFWHNIARADEVWWRFLVTQNQIPACFDNSPGDQGEKVLNRYMPGDIVVAYAGGYGAVGWGVVAGPHTYRLLQMGDPDDFLRGDCRHRLTVDWKATASRLRDAVSADRVRRDFLIYHPVGTSASMNPANGKRLLDYLSSSFSNAERAP